MEKIELANLIKSFLDGSCGDWDWDDFTSVKQSNPEIEKIRLRLINIPDEYPPTKPNEYCNEEGASQCWKLPNYFYEKREHYSLSSLCIIYQAAW